MRRNSRFGGHEGFGWYANAEMSTTPYAVPEVSTIPYSDAELSAHDLRQSEEAAERGRQRARKDGAPQGTTQRRDREERRASEKNAPRSRPYLKSCQKATAELAATFSESTPCDMGMMTDRSQAASARRESP